MVYTCCAYGCSKRFKKGCGVGFFRFPRNESRRKRWILAVKRRHWKPTEETRICGDHFHTGKPSNHANHPDYVPSIFTFQEPKDKVKNTKNECKRRCENKNLLKFQATKKNAIKHKTVCSKIKCMKNADVRRQRLPVSRPPGEENKKREKSMGKNITISGSEITDCSPINSYSIKYFKSEVNDEKLHIGASNENSSPTSDLSIHSILPELRKEIKIEPLWEAECNLPGNFEIEKEKNYEVYKNGRKMDETFQEKNSLLEQPITEKITDSENNKASKKKNNDDENRKNFLVQKFIKRKIDEKEKAFGCLISCEMSDLCKKPVLYVRTKQIILKALIDAHVELKSSCM